MYFMPVIQTQSRMECNNKNNTVICGITLFYS